MKFIFFSLAILAFFLASCGTGNDPVAHKKFSDTTAMEALYVTNPSTLALIGGPVKQVIQGDFKEHIDSTDPARKIVTKTFTVDTFYLLPNIDKTLMIKDKSGKPILNAAKDTQYLASFREPLILSKTYVHPTSIIFKVMH